MISVSACHHHDFYVMLLFICILPYLGKTKEFDSNVEIHSPVVWGVKVDSEERDKYLFIYHFIRILPFLCNHGMQTDI